jgi:hypothetical protein
VAERRPGSALEDIRSHNQQELAMTSRTGRIRALNDQLRATGCGGTVVVTRGIAALSGRIQAAIIDAVRRFDDSPWPTTRSGNTTAG